MSKSSSTSSAGSVSSLSSLSTKPDTPHTPLHPEGLEGVRRGEFNEAYNTLYRKRKEAKTPADHGRAEGEFRQARFVAPGLEGPLKTDNTYHLTTDVTAALREAVEVTKGLEVPRIKQETRRGYYALATLSRAREGRYQQGVRWLRVALEENGIAADDLQAFDQERERFAERFDPLMNTGPRPPLKDAEKAIREMFAELRLLQSWLGISGQEYRAAEMRQALADVASLWGVGR